MCTTVISNWEPHFSNLDTSFPAGANNNPEWRIPSCILEIVPERQQPPKPRKIRKERWKLRCTPENAPTISTKVNNALTSSPQSAVSNVQSINSNNKPGIHPPPAKLIANQLNVTKKGEWPIFIF